MDLYILNSEIQYIAHENEVILTEKDLHPCHPFFIEFPYTPESFQKIHTKGIFEITKYIRHVLKIMDALLSVGGEIDIEFFRCSFDVGGYPLRPLNYLMNEISVCYKNRYRVEEKKYNDGIDWFRLKKVKPNLPLDDLISRWSFGIVSDGRKNDRVLKLIGQIKDFKIPEYEVLICGPTPSGNLPEHVVVLDDSDLYYDLRIPISRKKNRIIDQARFNNLVIMHDRISFSENWYEKICKYGNIFDQICTPILDENTRSLRVNDWLKSFHDFTSFQKSISIKLEYSEWDRHLYVDGGFMLIKKHIISNNKLNPDLNWGEMEDVDLSERLYLDGASITFYQDTFLLTQTHRIQVKNYKANWWFTLLSPILNYRSIHQRDKNIFQGFHSFLEKDIK